MKPLAEKTQEDGIESENTLLSSVEKTAAKKKVKVVKKIVKKKVIKKVPKRVLVAPNCDHLEKVASPNPNDNVPMEIGKPNIVVDDLKESKDMELEVSHEEKTIHMVETNDSCRDESEKIGLITSPLLADQIRSELHDKDHDINNMAVKEQECEEGVKEQYHKGSKMDVRVSKDTKIDNSVEGEEGVMEQDHKSSKMDVGVSEDTKIDDNVEGEEGVKEQVENNETDGLRAEQGLSESRRLSGEMVASGCHMKQRSKIFIHGLDQETKEEDIRKVFEEVGVVVEVKIITNFRSGKSRGFGFIRYASAGLANLALKKYPSVKICGRQCSTAAVEGNETILLDNIDKKWNNEDVLALLQKIGIDKIDDVMVATDPENTELNRGFAFLELQTRKDAQMAYGKLQSKNVFGNHSNIKVSWAASLGDPVEEETHNIKSVYAQHIPASWGENEVKGHFETFGEIESIALARNLHSAKRKDFAFINYKTHKAALSCIEALTCNQSTSNYGRKAQLKVELAKSVPKVKPVNSISQSATTEVPKFTHKANNGRSFYKPQKPKNVNVSSINKREDARKDGGSSTTAELVHLLREQALWKLGGPSSTTGMSGGHLQPPFRGKQQFTELGSESVYHDSRAYLQQPRPIANLVATTSIPHYDQQRAHYTPGSFNGVEADPRYLQTRGQASYHGSRSIYWQMH